MNVFLRIATLKSLGGEEPHNHIHFPGGMDLMEEEEKRMTEDTPPTERKKPGRH